jgi:hypothetical protein
VGSQSIVGVAEQVDVDGEALPSPMVARSRCSYLSVPKNRATTPLVCGSSPWADVTKQRVVAGERVSEGHATKAWPGPFRRIAMSGTVPTVRDSLRDTS